MDELSFEFPKAVAKFSGLSSRCLDIVDKVTDIFIETCSARDMFTILCEQHHLKQVKAAFPVILNVLKKTCLEVAAKKAHTEMVNKNEESMTLFRRAIGIADSIKAVCTNTNKVNEELRALLGLYVLQIMALLSLTGGEHMLSYLRFVSQLTEFFPYCGLSYLGLITGSDVDVMANTVTLDEEDFMSCLCYVKQGACLSVIWCRIHDDVALGGEESMSIMKHELQNSQTDRWKAIGMLQHILASTDMLWELKDLAINFILWFTDGSYAEDKADCSVHLPNFFAASEAITKIMVNAPNRTFTKNAFEALKRVLADSPTCERFNIVKALIRYRDSPSMVPLLLELVREELVKEHSLWNPELLEFVETVLRPPGRLPCLPEDGIAVLAALNLYRFILIKESKGKSNCTGVLLEENLKKANNEWLLPLCNLVTGILSEYESETDQLAADAICGALNPVMCVLCRCIHLVEDKLK